MTELMLEELGSSPEKIQAVLTRERARLLGLRGNVSEKAVSRGGGFHRNGLTRRFLKSVRKAFAGRRVLTRVSLKP